MSISNPFVYNWSIKALPLKSKPITDSEIKSYSALHSEVKIIEFTVLLKTCIQKLPLFC